MVTIITVLAIILATAVIVVLIPAIFTVGFGFALVFLDVAVAALILIGLWNLFKWIFKKKS